MRPAIIVVAYERPRSLQRLLASLQQADLEGRRDVELIISIDHPSSGRVQRLAEEFVWHHGPKTVIEHESHRGLKNHVLSCGDLSDRYGAIIILEDDLVVSPSFYPYACQALSRYASDERIAGISLYSYRFNEFARRPFLAVDDGYDNYFLNLAVSWGQAWTSAQWDRFRSWQRIGREDAQGSRMPRKIENWPASSSWKRDFSRYMIGEQKYFVIPRVSLTTNFAEKGTHVREDTTQLQVPLLLSSKRFRFSSLETSNSVYDAFHELHSSCLKRLNRSLAGYDFECDLYGTKDLAGIGTDFILTTKRLPEPVKSFKLAMIPPELNVVFEIEGDDILLARVPR